MAKITKIAIANRGEVAVRIIRACQELGIQTVLLHSEPDVESLAYRISDEKICIGPAPTPQSYLNIESNIHAAKAMGAQAIHPGFGFLSENAEFAKQCKLNSICFIGPSAESIELFGDKISAKNLVQVAGVPVIPGYQGEDQSMERLQEEAEKIGYPLMVKVAAGGGGRGLRVVNKSKDLVEQVEAAKREGITGFGSDQVFLEKYLNRAKHIEVQIFGDCTGNIFHLYERECSVQRRHQKVIEEAGAADLSDDMRETICGAAVKIAHQAKYRGAGTIEFLLQDGEYYFLEMNTRLQVEHTVTEMVLGVDLVKAQIMTAQEKSLLWDQDQLAVRGHSIECRLYAEDPYRGGLPSTGKIGHLYFPMGWGRRFEVGIEAGDEITSYYDPMIAKIVVYDENRPRAIEKMITTLQDCIIFGVKTNIPYLIQLLSHPEFVEGSMNTKMIETYFPNGLTSQPYSQKETQIAKLVSKKLSEKIDFGDSDFVCSNPFYGMEMN